MIFPTVVAVYEDPSSDLMKIRTTAWLLRQAVGAGQGSRS